MTLLERLWAYITLGATGSFVGEAAPLIGGLAAFDRKLNLWPVVVAIALGTWLGGWLFYGLGVWRGRWIRKRWPRARPFIVRSVALVRRHPWRAAIAVRFAYGLRFALPIACGVARVRMTTYAVGTAISSIAWSIIFTVVGWALGRTTETLIGHVREYESAIGAAFVLLMIVGYVIIRRKQVGAKTAKVLERERAGKS